MSARRTRHLNRLPLRLLDLESRIAPATFTVTNANNSGTGSLRQAVINANNAAGADLIDFSSYFNVPRTITLASEIVITGAVTIDGTSAANVTVNGNNATRIFNANTGAAIGLVDLTLTAGLAAYGFGGAVSAAALTAARCVFTANTAGSFGFSGPGGAIYVGSLTATDCIFTGNRTTAVGMLEYNDCFSFGGAIYASGNSVLTRCEVIGNTAQDGGGLRVAGSLLVEASTISGNLAVGALPTYGGFFFGSGGGLRATGDTTVRNCTISGNSGGGGGGIWTSGALLVQNSTIAGNSATDYFSFGGGGISGSTVALESSIVANNRSVYPSPDVRASTVNARNSAIFSRSGITTFNDLGGNRPAGEDPRLGPLQDNGGPSRTHLLLPNSPCLQTGSNPANLTTDQRGPGFPRVVNGVVDMGAAEGVDVNPSVTPISIPGTIATPGGTSYTVVVRYDDDVGIDLATIDLGDITVTGPGYAVPQVPTARSIAGSGTVVTVTYTLPAPGGAFDFTDGGLYTVAMAANQVRDLDTPVSHAVAAGSLGSFRVAIPGTAVVDEPSDVDDGNLSPGHLSLREAVRLTNSAAGTADIIRFDQTVFGVPRAIVLTGGQLDVTDPLTVIGPGSGQLTLDASGASRHLSVNVPGAAFYLSGVSLINGSDGNGGAIWHHLDGTLILVDVVATNCEAFGSGGAIYSVGSLYSGGTLYMRDCTIRNNQAAVDGGGIFSYGYASVRFERTTVAANRAGASGGGLYIAIDGLVQIADCTISENQSNTQSIGIGGGGAYLALTPAAGSYIRNSTLSGNVAVTGGGLCLDLYDRTLAIANTTITSNSTTGSGGGIAVRGYVVEPWNSLNSTIVAGNSAGSGPDLYYDFSGPIPVPGNNNLIGVANAGNFTLTGTGNLTGTLASPLNPLLAPLANNGGPTITHALLPGSPALNAGNNAAGLATDQRGGGFVRVFGSAADIGAFEVQPSPPRVQAVTINDGSAQRSRVTSLTVTFNTQVTFAGQVKDAFTLMRNGGKPVSFTTAASIVNGVTVVTLSNFSGGTTQFGSLADGRYTLTALASQISAGGLVLDGNGDGFGGDNHTFGDAQGLFRMYGDINGDRRVDIADFGLFSISYLNPANFNVAFDFNGDGRIDIVDFGQLSVRYLTSLP